MKNLFTFILVVTFITGMFMQDINAQEVRMDQEMMKIPANNISIQNNIPGQDVLKTPSMQNNNTQNSQNQGQFNNVKPNGFILQSPMATIFSQNFESVWTIPTSLSPAWSGTTTPANNQWQMNTYTTGWTSTSGAYSPTGANSTTQSARFHTYDAATGTSGDLITPTMDFSSYTGYKALDFYYINTSGTDVVNVYLSTDNGATWGSSLKTVTTAAAWTMYTVILGTSTSTQCKIKFTATGDYGTTDIGVDEVVVRTATQGNAAPISFTATSVTQTSMTIGWTDNSTNETAFRVYRSTDNITFTQQGTDITSTTTATTGTTYSQAQTGLVPGQTYYFRIASVVEIESPYLTGSQATNAAGNIVSAGVGPWSAPGTWVGGVVPTATDNVTIADGSTVTIDVTTAACFNLTVGQGTGGFLVYTSGTASTLTVNNTITVAVGGSFTAGGGALLTHILNVGGTTSTSNSNGSINNGTFDMYTTAGVTLNLYGIPDASLTGTGATCDFYRVVLNKGAVTATFAVTPPVFDVQRAFTVQGANTVGLIYTHTAGVIKISGTYTQSNPIFTTVSYSLPAIAGIWLNNANFTVTGQAGSPTVTGLFRVSAGTFNIGTATGNSVGSGTGSVYIIEGGVINVAGRFNLTSTGVYYNQSGGTLTVNKVGNSSTKNAEFGLTSSTGTSFIMSGGSIVLQLNSTGTVPYDYYNIAGSLNITGGTLQFGNSSTAAAKTYYIYGYAPSVVVDGTFTHTLKTGLGAAGTGASGLFIYGNFTLNTGTTFNSNGFYNYFIGSTVTNNGAIVGTTTYDRFDFSGTAAQSYSGTGTFGTLAAPFTGVGVGIANTNNVTLNAPIYTTRVNLFTGGFVNSNQFNLGIGGTSSVYIQRGGGTGTAGTFDVSPVYNVGSGGMTVNYYTASNSVTSGYEIPASRAINSLVINNVNGVTLSGGVLSTAAMTMTLGNLTTTSTNLLTITGTATSAIAYTAGYINGPIARTLPASLVTGSTYLFPIGKSTYKPLELVNPTMGAGGTAVVKAEVFDANCGGTAGLNMASLNTNRYWAASITSGSSNFTNTFVRLTDSSVVSSSAIASSSTLSGTYDIVGGTSPTVVVGGSVLSVAPAATTIPGYYAIGTKAVNMSYTSSTTTQNTNVVNTGTTNQQIIGIQIVTTGNSNPLSATSLTVNANGTTNTADISNAKIFYTGTTSTFSAVNQFGSTVATPTIANFVITGTQALTEGTNYFWLTYDILSTATQNDSVDAECTSLTVGGTAYIPSITAPTGKRQILNQSVTGTGTATATWPVYRYYNYSTWECIYLQSELGTTKDITTIAFNKSSGTDITAITPVTIYMKHTASTALATGKYDLSGYTQVFSGIFPNTATSGWMEMALNSNFSYNGTDNLQVLIVKGNQTYTSTYPYYYGTTMGTTRARQGSSDSEQPGITGGAVDLTASTNVPNLRFNYNLPSPMAYTSSTTTQTVTSSVSPGSTNQQIVGLQVVTSGTITPISLSNIVLNTSGTTNVSDIVNAKVFYTGTSSTFAATSQFGTTVSSPSGDFTVSGSQTLSSGTNYFWLTYDISASAVDNNMVDANSVTLNVAGVDRTPTVTNPGIGRKVLGALSGDYIVSGSMFNKISGRNVTFDKRTRQVEVDIPVYAQETKEQPESKNAEKNRIISYKKEIVNEDYYIPMENGKEVNDKLFVPYSGNNSSKDYSPLSGVYASITAALTDLNAVGVSAPVRFLLNSTAYTTETLPLTINQITGANAVNTVTIKPNTGITASISGSSTSSIFKLNAAKYVFIDGSNSIGGTTKDLTIENTNTSAATAAIWLASNGVGAGATNNTIKNCNIKTGTNATATTYGIFSGGSTIGTAGSDNDYMTIQNNYIYKAYQGINITGVSGSVSNNLNITGNTIGAPAGTTTDYIGYYGLNLSYTDSVLVSQNIIRNIISGTIYSMAGIYANTSVTNINISKNSISSIKYTGSGGWGTSGITANIGTATTQGITISNNLIYDITADGYSSVTSFFNPIGISVVGTSANAGINIYYNSIYLYGNTLTAGGSSCLNLQSGITGGVNAVDNIFSNTLGKSSGTPSATGVVVGASSPTVPFTTINNNDYYVNSNTTNNIGYIRGTAITTLSGWQSGTTGTGQDLGSVSGDPKFLSTTDLHIDQTQISPVYKAGAPISGITTDYDGITRNATNPGIGAFEFTPLIAALLSPANNSVGNSASLNLVWSKPAGATKYNLMVATDTGFTSIVVNDTTLTDSTYLLSNLNPLTTYYWKVSSKFTNWSYFSSVFNFRTISTASTVTLSSPANNAVNQPTTLTFIWFKSVDQTDMSKVESQKSKDNQKPVTSSNSPLAVSNYWFEYSTDSTFATSIIDSTLSDTTKTLTGINNITTYYWRVKAKNQLGWASFSSVWNFTTVPPVPAAPTLLAPANNSVDLSTTPTLDWNDVTYAASYRVQISPSATFTYTSYDTTGLTVSQITVPAGKLTTNTKYYWRVSANNVSGTGPYSDVWKFTTAPNAPNVVTLLLPANNSINLPLSVSFNWTKAIETIADNKEQIAKNKKQITNNTEQITNNRKEGNSIDAISNYWFEYSTDSTFATSVIDSSLADTTKTLSGLSIITKYYWRVKAKNQTGWSGFSSTWNFTTIPPAPATPTLATPTDSTLNLSLTPALDWNDVTYADNYRVQIATDAGFTAISYDTIGLTVSQITVPSGKLTTNKLYYWRVSATNYSGTSSYSTAWRFTTAPNAPNVPVLSAPANNATSQPVTITFKWYKAIETLADNIQQTTNSKEQITNNKQRTTNTGKDSPLAISNYWFEYSTDSTFATVIARDSSLADTTKILTGLSNLTKYYWRVKAKNQTGWSSFSLVWNFSTNFLAQTNFTAVSVPQYMATDIGNTRVPMVFRGTVTGLTPYKFYRYYGYGGAYTDIGTAVSGAGTVLFINKDSTHYRYAGTPSLTAPAGYDVFRADAAGSFTGWFCVTPTTNTRFAYGKYIIPTITLGDSLGATIARYAMNDSIKVLSFSTASADSSATGIWGISAGLKTNIVTLFDNVTGTGKPITQTFLETDSVATITSWAAFYRTNVDAQTGRWGVLIPNNNSNGIRRIEQRSRNTGSILTFNTSATGVWPGGANTVNPAGGATTPITMTMLDAPLLDIPTLLTPANNSVDLSTTPLLDWNDVTLASIYRVQVAADTTFAAPLYDTAGLTVSQITVPSGKLTTNTKYYWRAIAGTATAYAVWSSNRNFTTAPNAPNVPLLASPASGSINMPTTVTCVWYKAIETITDNKGQITNNKEQITNNKQRTTNNGKDSPLTIANYWYEYSQDSTFATGVVRDSSLTDTTKVLAGLNNFTTYYWRVKARNQTGWSGFSSIWNFRTIVASPGAPTLSSPANNATAQPLALSLVWNRNGLATLYNVQLSTDPAFGSFVVNDSTVTDSTKAITGLNPLTNYYWRVRSYNLSGWSSFSSAWTFKTIGTASQVVLSTPANNATGQPTSVTFKWFKAVDLTNELLTVSNYWFEYGTDSTFATVIARDSSLTDTTKSVTGLSNITKYYWRVKAKNQINWGSFSAVWNLTTIVPAPAAPILLTPANGTIDLTVTPTLDWNDVTYAASYRVQVSTGAAFTTTVYDSAGLTVSQITVPSGKLTTNSQYYWRVSATNVSGTSVYSSIWNFTTAPNAPNVPLLASPANGAANQPTTLTFQWYKAIETITDNKGQITNNKEQITNNKNGKSKEAQTDSPLTIAKYWYEYSTDSTFATGVVRDSSLTDTTKVLAGLNNLTSYFWRVKAKNQTGWGNFSTVWNFTTIVSSPGAPTLISPVNNATGQALALNLVWSKITSATKYNVQLSTDPAFGSFIVNDSTITDTIKALTSLNNITSYYWRVRSFNVSGWSSFSSAWTFKTIGTASQVVLSTPANNATGQPTSITFNWFKAIDLTNELLTVSNYWLEYGTDSIFATVIARDSSLTDTTKSVTGLGNNTKYYWRVKAKNQIGWGGFSATWNFTTVLPTPIAPVLTSPVNNSTGISLTPALVWGSVTNAASYRIQVSADSTFTTTSYDTAGVTVTTLNVPANKLTGLTKYYWRVNATNVSGTGSWSTMWNFSTVQNLPVTLKVYLEGFWDGTSQVSDTVNVYLANQTTPFAYADTAKVVLSTSGTATFSFSKAVNGSYYIVVSHRNHLETWSKLPQVLTTNVTKSYDFTTAATQAYGDNMKQVGSVWVLYGGDANGDGSVDAIDVPFIIAQFGTQGYLSADFNGDMDVNASDIALFVPNFGVTKVVPTVVMVPVIKTKDIDIKNKNTEDKSKKKNNTDNKSINKKK